ncbi:MAG: molybdopterin-dependent oxidoreductase, partial [Nonomuraea sp.]|nr:molybdopterin-dependent oxidoreductase [Nonomuraea sp.]
MSRRPDPRNWASWRPFGLGLRKPNNYLELWKAFRSVKGNRRYAWRILNQGTCDGCALGTQGMRDWTMDEIHLCNIRLRLLPLNTMPALDVSLLRDVSGLAGRKSAELRELGRLPYPMLRRAGEPGFTRVSWDEALRVAGDGLRGARFGAYMTSRGVPNENYYAAQKAVRALGTNNVDNAARI